MNNNTESLCGLQTHTSACRGSLSAHGSRSASRSTSAAMARTTAGTARMRLTAVRTLVFFYRRHPPSPSLSVYFSSSVVTVKHRPAAKEPRFVKVTGVVTVRSRIEHFLGLCLSLSVSLCLSSSSLSSSLLSSLLPSLPPASLFYSFSPRQCPPANFNNTD